MTSRFRGFILISAAITAMLGFGPGIRSAQARVSLFGGVNYAAPIDSDSTFVPALGYGGGLALTIFETSRLGAQMNVAYWQRKFTSSIDASEFSGNWLQNSLIVRYRPFSQFWFGLGPYYSGTIGKLGVISGGQSSSIAYSKPYDYGLDFSLKIGSDKHRIGLDLRYSKGFVNVATTGTAKYEEAKALLVIRLGRLKLR